jgi:hypothetical protein
VIGGVSLFGGSGTPLSAVLGALLLTEIENILALLRISIFAEQTLEGTAIVVAVAVYAVASRKLRRPLRREQLLIDGDVPSAPSAGPSTEGAAATLGTGARRATVRSRLDG